MAMKTREPALAFGGYGVSPDEMDRYEVFQFTPASNVRWFASAGTSGTATTTALTILNRLPDTPRNVNFILAGSATGMAGSLDINGRDQFGAPISETLGFGSADNGGTVVGTKVFAQFNSGTLRFGTAVGAGTPQIGFVPGTNCLLGLPVKIKAATDVVSLSQTVGTGAISYNGGTIAAFVNVAQSAIRPATALAVGTNGITAWVKSTFDSSSTGPGTIANLQQAV